MVKSPSSKSGASHTSIAGRRNAKHTGEMRYLRDWGWVVTVGGAKWFGGAAGTGTLRCGRQLAAHMVVMGLSLMPLRCSRIWTSVRRTASVTMDTICSTTPISTNCSSPKVATTMPVTTTCACGGPGAIPARVGMAHTCII